MSDSIYNPPLRKFPTAASPLLGLTVLVVEDSRFASEAVRLMCQRSGARLRRADCLTSAQRHLKSYRPAVALIDLGLPDGSGEDLIQSLAQSNDPVAVLIATSGDISGEARARAAGAQAFLAKPIPSLGLFQQTILDLLPPEARPKCLRPLSNDSLSPDQLSFQDDLLHAANLIRQTPDGGTLRYVAQFLEGIGVSARDQPLIRAARDLARDIRQTDRPDLQSIQRELDDRMHRRAAI